jgi:hypothetical protein
LKPGAKGDILANEKRASGAAKAGPGTTTLTPCCQILDRTYKIYRIEKNVEKNPVNPAN